MNEEFFRLTNDLKIYVSEDHRFGTDAFLLAGFAHPLPSHKVCDLCTGCGIIPFLMCRKKPPKEIYGVEIMKEAVSLFEKSVEENGLTEKVRPVLGDLKDVSALPQEYFDMVTVNPPYWKKGTGDERLSQAQAAARHEILCDINDVIKAAAKLLKFGGSLKLCQIPSRLTDVICAMRENNIEPKVLRFVKNKENEKPWLFLISGKKGGKSGLEVEKEFVIKKQNDEYTEEMNGLYLIEDING